MPGESGTCRPDRRLHRPRAWRPRVRARTHLRAGAARPPPGPDRRAQPRAQRDRLPRRGTCPRGRGRRRPGARRGRRGRPAARPPARVQGHPRGRGVAHDLRLDPVRRPRPRRRRAPRRAGPPGRRGRDRQDERAGVRGRVAHVQQGLRHHPQPGRPVPLGRRVQRGSGVRAGRGHGAPGRRLRHGGLAAQPRASAASSDSARASAGCPNGRRTTSGRPRRSADRWPATSETSPSCSRCWPAPTRGRRSRSGTPARRSRRPWPGR